MSNQQTTKGKAVVTGASSGIGKVYAEELGKLGYDLLLVARRADRLQALKAQIEAAHGVEVQTLTADLSKAQEIDKVAEQLRNDTAVAMLVNNAGTSIVKPFAETQWTEVEPMIQLNVTALTALTLAVLPGFKQRNSGEIINIGSVVGFYGWTNGSVYGGTKAYVLNFTRTLQSELADTGIRVQLVTPAATVSEVWDIQGLPLSALPQELVMSTEDCVAASLQGLHMGEKTTAPSLEDAGLLERFETASKELFQATQAGKPASRYSASR